MPARCAATARWCDRSANSSCSCREIPYCRREFSAVSRSLLAPLVTLIPAVFALLVSMRFIGGLGAHGIKTAEITELLLIVLLLGAGTDYGLFLVFRVREEIRGGREPRDAVAHALVRVGESISASAGAVILALLTLLLASFGIYKDLGVPLAVGIAVMLLAGLTLLPTLLAIFGSAVFWPARVSLGTGRDGLWGTIAGRLVRRPAITLGIGLLCFLRVASAALGYHSGGFGGATNAPAGSQAAAGNAALARHFPQSSANPANLVFRYRGPVWDNPAVLATADSSLRSSGQFTALAGPLNPDGQVLTVAQYAHLHAQLGSAAALPPAEPASAGVPAAVYNAYRATGQFVSADGRPDNPV
jgi:RND superfamily putative drug exporter